MRHGPRRTTVADSCGFPGKRRRGGNLPPGKFSWVASWAMHPHFLFRLAEKKTGRTRKGYAASVSGKAANGCAVHGPKEKAAWAHSGAVALRAHGGRRIGASADLGLPSGTLSSSTRSILPSRGGWCRPRRGGCRIASASLFAAAHAPVRKSQRQRKSAQDVSQTSPGWRFPQGQRVFVPDCRKGPPTIPRLRRPTRRTFFLFHRARRIFFLMSQKENGGRIPHGQCPPAGARPLWPPFGGLPSPAIHMADFPRPMGRTPIKRIQIL